MKKIVPYLSIILISSCIPKAEMPLTKFFEANDSLTIRALEKEEMYKYQVEYRGSFTTAPPSLDGELAKEHWEKKYSGKLFWSDAHEVYYEILIDTINGDKTINFRDVDKFASPPILSYKELIALLNKEDCRGCKIVDISKPEAENYPEYSKEFIEQKLKESRSLRAGIINERGQLFDFSIYTPIGEDSIGNKVISDYSSYSTKYYYTGQAPDPPPPVFDEEGNIIPDEE